MSMCVSLLVLFFFFKQKTAYEMRISDWSSDVCSSDLDRALERRHIAGRQRGRIDRRFEHPHLHLFAEVEWIGAGEARAVRVHPRSEERRVGKECVSTCRSRWSPYQ